MHRLDGDRNDGAQSFQATAPLSFAQERLWFLEQLEPDAVLYNIPVGLRLKGNLSIPTLERCIREVVERHAVLRTSFRDGGEGPEQLIHASMQIPFTVVDLRSLPDGERELQAGRRTKEEAAGRFDLAEGPLARILLLRMGELESLCLLTMHHIVSDGWSMGVLVGEIAALYGAFMRGEGSPLPPLSLQYAEFAGRQRQEMAAGLFDTSIDYWRRKLDGVSPLPLLPASSRRNIETSHAADVVHAALSPELTGSVIGLSSRLQASPYMTLLAACSLVFGRYGGSDDIVLGSLIANRHRAELEPLIGFFVNTLPLRVDLSGSPTLRETIGRVRDITLEAYGHQEIPFEKIVEIAQPERSSEAMPLVQVMVIMQNAPIGELSLQGLTVTGYPVATRTVRFDVEVYLWEAEGSLQCDIVYKKEIFARATVERLWRHLETVLAAMVADIDAPARTVSLLTAEEKAGLIATGEGRTVPIPRRCVHQLFSAQARKTPGSQAVVETGGISKTYAELEADSNRIAHYLAAQGLEEQGRVGVCMGRSAAMLAVLLGIMKAGGVYVPMDPAWPLQRTAFVARDCRMSLLIVDGGREGYIREAMTCLPAETASPAIVRSNDLGAGAAHGGGDTLRSFDPSGGAYIIYTSGSTGEPKGVLVEHRSVVNYITWALRQYGNGRAVDFPLFSSLAFDLTVTSLFVPLIGGGTVRTYDDDPADPTPVILRVMADDMVDVVKLTPAHLALVVEAGFAPRRIHSLILGGEDLKVELARAACDGAHGRVTIYNEYGPTEATVGCMIHRFDPAVETTGSVSIGGPIDNSFICILDKDQNFLPTGIVGELCVGGAGVAREYVGREELTAERFIASPSWPGTRIYRTGDRARWEVDGKIAYLGRVDRQIKIRGYRVEPGEIESVLLEHPQIQNSAVICREAGTASAGAAAVHYCSACGMPSNYPGIDFDGAGVCTLCRDFAAYRDRAGGYFRTLDDLRDAMKKGTGQYDCLVLYSGGKDSTYMLCRLVEMGYRILAFTLDNGYLYETAGRNIRTAVDHLGVDCLIHTPPAMRSILGDSLATYSNVCNGCFKSIYTAAIQTALDKRIPYIVTGLSRGQLFETRLGELFGGGVFDDEGIDAAVLEARKAYHRMEDAVRQTMAGELFATEKVFEEIQFIDFYRYCDVTRNDIFAYLKKHMTWIIPTEIGCSTNCAVNDVGIFVHRRERGFHNYALPGSWEVRIGHRSREDFLAELAVLPDPGRVHTILRELDYPCPPDETADLFLSAFYTAESAIDEKELRAHLGRYLPPYMVPGSFTRVEALPLTINGKVDHAKLSRMVAAEAHNTVEPVAPRTATEQVIAAIWRDVLRRECADINADFFEIGGHSLAATRVAARVKRQFGVDIPLRMLFDRRTVADLSLEVEAATVQSCEEGSLEAMLDEISGLSDIEIAKYLSELDQERKI
jgi:amino acid adenylation domain-containing protein